MIRVSFKMIGIALSVNSCGKFQCCWTCCQDLFKKLETKTKTICIGNSLSKEWHHSRYIDFRCLTLVWILSELVLMFCFLCRCLCTQNCHRNNLTCFYDLAFLTTRDQDRDLWKMNSSALESRDLGLEITTLANSSISIAISKACLQLCNVGPFWVCIAFQW